MDLWKAEANYYYDVIIISPDSSQLPAHAGLLDIRFYRHSYNAKSSGCTYLGNKHFS